MHTEYLIDLLGVLGVKKINKQVQSLNLPTHELIYPIVGALLIPEQPAKETEGTAKIIKKMENMSMQTYRKLASNYSNKLKEGSINTKSFDFHMSMDAQKIWSDRLPGASAEDYGRLLTIISNNELSPVASQTIRDLLEWPMEYNPTNKGIFATIGSKDGSTAFVLTDAIYAETLQGDKIEMVILTNDLNSWEAFKLNLNLNAFEADMMQDVDYRNTVSKILDSQ